MITESTIAELVVNDAPAFGLEEIAEKTANLFRKRKGNNKLNDHLNFDLIKGAYLGFLQVEINNVHGIPTDILQQLNTSDIIAFYYGINKLKAVHPDNVGLDYGQPFEDIVDKLISTGYETTRENCTINAISEMKGKLGFTEFVDKNPTIKERMQRLNQDVKIQFLRAYFTPRHNSQETHPKYETMRDEVFDRNKKYYGKGVDSNKSRDDYVHAFIGLIKDKQQRGNNFDNKLFYGEMVPSESKINREYLVQARKSGLSGNTTLNCSCPHGFNATHDLPRQYKGAECKHITQVKVHENFSSFVQK